jgi:hypothetical protein
MGRLREWENSLQVEQNQGVGGIFPGPRKNAAASSVPFPARDQTIPCGRIKIVV